MEEFWLGFSWYDSAVSLVIILIAYLLGLLLRWIFSNRLGKLAQRTPWKWDEVVVEGVRRWIPFWALLAGIYLALGRWALEEATADFLNKALFSIIALTVTLVIANIASRLIFLYSEKIKGALPATSLTQNITRIIIIILGALILLNGLGISITPLLTTLGIGGLAVALALQDTLSNLFAGFYITMARQVRIGDFVKLESGQEGYVTDIGWRATRVRMLPNNIVLIPNAKLAQSVITNYYLPVQELAVLVQVGVHYDSDLEKVERVTIEVGKQVMREVPGGVPEFTPFIRYHTFGDFAIGFTVILRAKEFVDNYLIKHEFIKRLHVRYEQEGIVIPFPIWAINYSQEGVSDVRKDA